MPNNSFIILILGMGIVSFIPRWVPLFFLSKREIPKPIVEWLELIPVSILSALLFPSILLCGENSSFSLTTPEFLVSVPTFIFAWFTKSLGGTLVFGMFLYWASGYFL